MNRDTNLWNNRNLGRRNRLTNNRSKLQSTPSDSATSKTWPSHPGSYGQYLSRTQSPSIRHPQAYSSSWTPPAHPWSAYATWSYPYGNQQYNPGRTGNYGTERSNTGYGSYGVNNSSQETRPQDTSSKIDSKTDIKPNKCGALPPGAPPALETQLSPPQTEPAASSSSGYASLQSSAGQSPPSTSSTGQSPDSKSSLEPLPSASGVQRNGSGIRSGRPPEITKIDLDDDDDDVCVVETAGVTAAVKTEDVKPAMDCIDLSKDGNCPEEILNRFHYEARTKILQQLCATFDETGFLEALKQLKLLLEKQRAEVKMKCDLMQLLTRFLLFLGSNYSSIGTVFVEEYLELMEDVIVHYCEVVREYMLVQLERKKRRNLKRLGTRIKFVMARCLLYRMDSIMHCLFRVQLYPGEQEHCFLWTDIFIYFLKRVKYEPKDDDVVRAYIGWQKMKTIRSAADADLIDDVMCMQLGKELEEMKKIPCLKEILDAKQADSRYDVRDMLTRYWRWWKEERPREPWTDLEEPTVMELPGRPDLELAALALSTSSSTKTVDEVARLLEDRRSGRNPGLIQQAAQKRQPKTTGAFSPSIFDDDDISLCVEDSDGDDDDVIIESITKRPEEVVVVLSDSDGDDDGDDIVFVEPEEPSEAPAEAPVEPVAAEPDEVAADEPVAEKAAAVASEPMEEVTEEPPSQVDSDIASEKPPPIAPEEPKAPQETKGIFDDSDDDDFEEPIVPEKPSDNQSTRDETLSEPLPSSNNWTDWDDQWAQLEEKPGPYLLEFMERPETPDEDCEDKVTAPPNPPKRYSIFEKPAPAPFESWCSEPLEFGSSDEETEPAATPRTVSEDNSSITIKHEQLSEECASESSQNVNKDDLVPEEDEAVAGEPEIALDDGDEAKESVETTTAAAAVEQNTEESKDFENQSLNDKTEDVPQETVEENASQQPENSDVNVAPEEATEAADAAGESIEETPVVPSDVIEDDKREDTVDEPATEKATASDKAENLPKPHEDATISSSDATETKEDDSCVTQLPQQPDEPPSSKNVFSVRSLVIEIEKLPPTKPSNGETTVAEEEDEDIGFNLADININGFSSDDDDVGVDYRQSTMVEGGEVSQRDGLGLGISPISKVAVEAGESLKAEDVLQSDKDSNTQDTHNVSKPQNSSCSSDSCNNPSFEMLDKVEVQHHFDAAARKHLGMLSPNSRIIDCSTSISDLSSLSTTLSTDLSSSVEKPMNARDPRLAGQSDVAKRYKQSLDESASTNRLAVNGWNESVMDATVINCNEVGSKDDQVVDATVICNNEDGSGEAVPAAEAHSLVDLYTNFAKEVSVEAQETDASTNNTDNVIMLQCSSITKEDAATAVPPVSLLLTPDRAFDDQHFNNDKQISASSYEILMPQGGYSENIPLSGSQPCSPQNSPDTRTNGAVQENSAILYHPILKQYPGLKPAVVPKQDALKMTNNNTTEAVNFVKMPSPQKAKPAPVPQPLSIFGSKFGNKDRQEAPRKGRRRSTAESRKKDANKSPKHITAEDESDLFQNALEGPTGKPLRNSGGNMFWDESDDAAFKGSSISVKADSQLKNNAQLRRSILKTSSTRRKAVKFALSNENEIKACKNPADLDPRFHEPAVIKINDRDIISKSIMQRYMEMRAEERRRLKLQQEAHKRALERAQMMELNEQQQHRQDNNIVYYIFSDKWDKKDKHLIPKCSSYAPRVRFKGKTDDHNHGNHRNGERPPEKRKRREHTSDVPAKRVRITVPDDLAEKEEEAPELERDRPNGVSHHRKSKMSARSIAMERKSKNAASEFTATTKHSLMGKKANINPVLASKGVDLMENGSTSLQTKSGRLRHKPSGKDYYDVTKRTTGRRKTAHQF